MFRHIHIQVSQNGSTPESFSHYPLVNYHSYGKSPFLMGNSTINCNFQ